MKKLTRIERMKLINVVKELIYSKFPSSVVIWCGTGTPSDNYQDNTEVFEAYMITDEDFEDFVELKWKIRREINMETGVTISIRDLTPEETKEFRSTEYETGLQLKYVWRTCHYKVGFDVKQQNESSVTSSEVLKLAEWKRKKVDSAMLPDDPAEVWPRSPSLSNKDLVTQIPDLAKAA